MNTLQTTDRTTLELLHRLLYRALIELREQGHISHNKVMYHLADLFHNLPPRLAQAADGQTTYEEVLQSLEAKAQEKQCEGWLQAAVRQVGSYRNEG